MIKNLEVVTEGHSYIINNLYGFIEFIQLVSSKGYTWFRGQSNSDWDLVPGLSRGKEFNKGDGGIQILKYMVKDFNNAVDDAIRLVKDESRYSEIKQLNLSKLQFMLLAQHYGLITPFIDWSTNPNIALFFSLFEKKRDSNFSPIIYATNPKMINYSSAVVINEESIYEIIKSDKHEYTEYILKELKNIEGYNTINSFVWPIAIESDLDFSHRITFQSGRFTINGPKKPFENVQFKNTLGTMTYDKTAYLNISAEINIDKKVISKLESYLKDFGYTEESVLRLGDRKSKLLDDLFKEVNERHDNISKKNYI